MPTAGRQFYDRQIACLETGDVPRLIAEQYHADAILIGFDMTVQGHAALFDHFTNYMAQVGQIKLKSTDRFTETDDAIFFEATILTAHGEARVYNVFLLKDNKATHHFTGLIAFTPFA
jgi:hypothetical protein